MTVSVTPVDEALVGTWLTLRGKWTNGVNSDLLDMVYDDLCENVDRRGRSRDEYIAVLPERLKMAPRDAWADSLLPWSSNVAEVQRRSIDGLVQMLGTTPKGVNYWLVHGRVYSTKDVHLTPEDVEALANLSANKRRLVLEKAHAVQAMARQLDSQVTRKPIPQDVKVTVWQRDGGRCVECGSNKELEFDHIIPLAMGGSNTMRNLQLLCALCNRTKGATLG
jgi:glycine/D-amino acid oxidase-like deaminating enzyme